jgi:hypothetical protein
MTITQTELQMYFQVGDRIKSGGGVATFEIVAIESGCVRVQPVKAKNPARLDLRKLSAVLDHASQIEEEIGKGVGIENAVGKALDAENLHEMQTETYLWGFVVELLIRRAASSKTISLEDYNAQFGEDIKKSLAGTPEARRNRLTKAPKIPKKFSVTSVAFERNPDVVAEVLERAKGICGRCKHPAPFVRRSDQSPYLEVHHIKPLAQGGEDTVANAIALCPNCHRKAHYA